MNVNEFVTIYSGGNYAAPIWDDYASYVLVLVTNGDFATDNNWIKGSGWTISGGSANASNSTADLYQENVVESGRYYQVTYTISNYVGGSVRVELPSNAYTGTERTANGTYTETLLSGGTILLFDARTSFTGSIDNVSVTDVTASVEGRDCTINNLARLIS